MVTSERTREVIINEQTFNEKMADTVWIQHKGPVRLQRIDQSTGNGQYVEVRS